MLSQSTGYDPPLHHLKASLGGPIGVIAGYPSALKTEPEAEW